MRLKQDTMYTRFGGTLVFVEPSDAIFDARPIRPVPSFTRRKKVNRMHRQNSAARKILVGMFYNVHVGAEAVILGGQNVNLGQEAEVVDLGAEAEALEVIVLGDEDEVVEAKGAASDEDELVEEVPLDEGDVSDLLASLLEAKGAPSDEDELVEEVPLDEGDVSDLLASLLEAKGAASEAK